MLKTSIPWHAPLNTNKTPIRLNIGELHVRGCVFCSATARCFASHVPPITLKRTYYLGWFMFYSKNFLRGAFASMSTIYIFSLKLITVCVGRQSRKTKLILCLRNTGKNISVTLSKFSKGLRISKLSVI